MLTTGQLEAVARDGYVVLPGFFRAGAMAAARAAVNRVFAPAYADWRSAGGRNALPHPRRLFPWGEAAIDRLAVDERLRAIAEQVVGTRRLLLCEAHLGAKYPGCAGDPPHTDHHGNSLGPEPADPREMLRTPVFFVYLTDVGPDEAPIMMIPHGAPDGEARAITGAAGTVTLYTQQTRHHGTPFLAAVGQRLVMWVALQDAGEPFALPRLFTIKSGREQSPSGDYEARMARFMADATHRDLELLGFPPADDPWWTPRRRDGMRRRWPGFAAV
ncbi:MAG TPA: phytanoyl-CoA dioxygenase family protein [Planctomycetota bacterium]|nr:phytanoyl-CoA dioxygenase family protein [Planctomycetota bacterium]